METVFLTPGTPPRLFDFRISHLVIPCLIPTLYQTLPRRRREDGAQRAPFPSKQFVRANSQLIMTAFLCSRLLLLVVRLLYSTHFCAEVKSSRSYNYNYDTRCFVLETGLDARRLHTHGMLGRWPEGAYEWAPGNSRCVYLCA